MQQLKFQYNKTEMQRLRKQLAIREQALPTLKSKESALRAEVKKIQYHIEVLKKEFNDALQKQERINKFWVEFPDILSVENIDISVKKIAGVKLPILGEIQYRVKPFSLVGAEAWFHYGMELLKNLTRLTFEIEIANEQFERLTYARKKTTQKVNLYEKVQIPAYREALRKIKRFLEDKENLMKSAQKIVKDRHSRKIEDEKMEEEGIA